MHYFAYENNKNCIKKCFDEGMLYYRDKFGNTPLQYAI